jgi:hypothetical protein
MTTATLTPGTAEDMARMREAAAATKAAQREVCQRLTGRELSLAHVLGDGATAPVERMRVLRLLKAVPGIGDWTARRCMDAAHVPHAKRVGGLGRQQREALLRAAAYGG